ncbi:unnamed protein product [Mytilus coruscus]|uniref:Endonuclease/exonuclease/phosphatase domain-containing protein n=1 Tax=Mytilus coruscus TaxID=42192 RepID=A0A6J8EBN4_MYTCO|nr:unnamed protein product [Mytilus coruscus]
MNDTPNKAGLKRELSFSPSDISPSQIQVGKSAKTIPDSPSPNSSLQVAEMSQPTNISAQGETVLQLSEVVLSVINNPQFVQAIVPMVLEKVLLDIKPMVEQMVSDKIQPFIEAIEQNKQALTSQNTIINDQQNTINKLQTKVTDLGKSVEEQEQYSRRTSLRFNNIKIPTNGNGRIIKPINTDFLVLQICNEQLGLDINLKDLSRTHPIGKVKNGKKSVIVRFLSYRTRQLVFSNKKKLKNNEDKLFISENLTKYRYGLMKHLNVLRFTEKIHSFWTHDGKIIAKETPESDCIVISCNQDIRDLGGDVESNPGPANTVDISDQSISIFHCNIRSLRNKLDYISNVIEEFDIIFFSETHLAPFITNEKIALPEFETPIRKDRNSDGGGVIMYYKSNIKIKRRLDLEHDSLEIMWFELKKKIARDIDEHYLSI